MDKQRKEVERRLQTLAKNLGPHRWKSENYIGSGTSSYVFLDLRVPRVRDESRRGYSFTSQDLKTQWKVWDHIWNTTRYFEPALAAAHFVNSRPIEELFENKKKLLTWVDRCDNWAHSDELSNMYSRLLEYDRKQMLPVFERWNQSDNPWEKRQSLVGLLFYSRFRQKTLPCSKILKFVDRHINDDHYYVQKAVGWTLRECWNVFPEPTMKYLKKNAGLIPPGGWTAATEKLNRSEKSQLMSLRKAQKLRKKP